MIKPEDVHEILVGFEYRNAKSEIEVKRVESLWGFFKWAGKQFREFEHLPCSCKIMASMLVQAGFYGEVENLLSRRECQGFLLDCKEIFSDLIEGYVREFELDRAVLTYERMRSLGLVPSMASYQALLRYLIEVDGGQLIYHVYEDMINVGMGGSVEEKWIHENVIQLLCVDGRVQEARDLYRKVASFGFKPSDLVVDAIIRGYCDKKDYADLLSFFADMRVVPDVIRGNKILSSLCKDFGVEEASIFLQDLEELGFCPNEISVGILIGSSCREGRLKNAFFYMSDIVSSGLKPHVYSYNAILSGIFKEGMWLHARDILIEMKDMGVTPDLSTYKVLLAGFCKARQFDEVKAIVYEMLDCDIVKLSSLEEPLAKGFKLVGLGQLNVKIRRDNDKGLSKAEFFDKLGNGLYLDTDLDEYEKIVSQVLNDAMMPDFNSYIMEKSESPDTKDTLLMVDEMTKWGQELSLPALCSLFCCLARAPFGVKVINHHLEVMSKSTYHLDESTLNILVQANCKNGFTFRARTILDGMVRRGYTVNNSTYSALLFDACKKGDLMSLRSILKLASKSNWSLEVKDGKPILRYMFKNKLFDEALELFETMPFISSNDISDIIEAVIYLDRIVSKDLIPDHIKYDHSIQQLCRHGRLDKAVDLLNVMLQRRSPPESTSYDSIIQGFCNGQKLDAALNFHTEMMYRGLKPSTVTWDALIRSLSEHSRLGEAEDLLRSMVQLGETPSRETFDCVISGYRSEKNASKTSELLKVMQQKGYEPDFDTHWSVISNLSHSSKKEGDRSFLSSLLSGFGFARKNR